MTSPDLIDELKASSPGSSDRAASAGSRDLRPGSGTPGVLLADSSGCPCRRIALVAVPAAAALAIASAGVLGLARSDGNVAALRDRAETLLSEIPEKSAPRAAPRIRPRTTDLLRTARRPRTRRSAPDTGARAADQRDADGRGRRLRRRLASGAEGARP